MTTLVWRCTENDNVWQTFIGREGEIKASVNSCDCEMFGYNGSCEHVAFMRDHFCAWASDQDHAPPLAESPAPRCPVCGGHVAVFDEDS
jgi:hypothetical protein